MIFKNSKNMGSFSEADFEQKLLYLKDTHDSISSLSSWCLSKHEHHAKIVSTWLNVLKGVKIEHRLILFYLANDVIQYSKRKSLPFVDAFAPALQKATTMVREDSVRNKILRLFKIWDERGIYDEGFLVDLSSLLSHGHKNANGIDLQDFQPSLMYSKIRSCKQLEDETDLRLKLLNENHISFTDVEKLRNVLKDRTHGDDVISDFDEGLKHVKAYIDALEAEIKERHNLIDLLETGEQHYAKEFKEAKVVVNAYKCFATRVRGVKRKLEEKLESMPSPIPSPDINAPSPSPEPKEANSGEWAGDADLTDTSYYTKEESEKFPDPPYSPELPKSNSYTPPQTYINNQSSSESNPKVYVPPKVNKPYSEYIKEEYGKTDGFYAGFDKKESMVKAPSFYSDTSRDSAFSGVDNLRESYFSNPPNPNFYTKEDIKAPKYFKSSEEDNLLSRRGESPVKVKAEYYPTTTSSLTSEESSKPLLTSDMQYFPKSVSVSSYPVGAEIPSTVPPVPPQPKLPFSTSKYVPDSDSYPTHSYISDYNRDESSNDENTFSSSDKILPENFVKDASFSKTSFAESLKDFYLPKSNQDNFEAFSRSSRTNGVEDEEGKRAPNEKIALSALLQTLIPPDKSSILTIHPKSPSANDSESWQTPQSPPLYEKSGYPPLYDDPAVGQDIDMRHFDVDHRNLISLTNPENPDWGNDDADYRTFQNAPSPTNEPVDDVENVDMEMSDDEEKGFENIRSDPMDLLKNITPAASGNMLKEVVNEVTGLVPPPPPPPPPQPWQAFPPPPTQPPPNFNQVPIFFNRPPPPQHTPPSFRPNFRPFHRPPPPRFQRW